MLSSFFKQVTPEKMAEEQQEDPIFEQVYQWVLVDEKQKTSAIAQIKSKAVTKYLFQFDRLTIKREYFIVCTSIMM